MRGLLLWTLALGCTPAAAQAPPESVAEAAQRARAQDRTRAARVYTEDDLPRLRLLPISVIGTLAETGEALERPDFPPGPSEEQIWRARFAAAREELARAEKELAQWQRAFDGASLRAAVTMDWNFLSCPSQGSVFAPGYTGAAELSALCARINASRERFAAAREKLASLEEELRRSGGQPGWARD